MGKENIEKKQKEGQLRKLSIRASVKRVNSNSTLINSVIPNLTPMSKSSVNARNKKTDIISLLVVKKENYFQIEGF